MKSLTLSAIVIAIVSFTGCADESQVQTVAWYKNHESERKEILATCKNNPGEHSLSPNCINASTAANELILDMRDYETHAPINVLDGSK